MSAVPTPRPGCEFDGFLYASVGDDNNGMPLTVLSAFARMDVDPWEQACKLTQLTNESAVKELAALLGTLRNSPVTALDLALVAPLVALLPNHHDRGPATLKAAAQGVPTKHLGPASNLLSVLIFVSVMLLMQWLMGNFQTTPQAQSSARPPTTASPTAPTSSAVSPSSVD